MTARTLQIPANRLARWVAGFEQRHGPAERSSIAAGALLIAADGSTAELIPPFLGPPVASPIGAGSDRAAHPIPNDPVAEVIASTLARRTLPVLLLRRGGYACALLEGDRITAAKVGSRYVQGRTAAGGWSQQRFARRREGQTQALIGAAVEQAVRLLVPAVGRADALVTGGDAALVTRALADPRLRALAALPRGPVLDVGDPRSDVVQEVPARLRAVRVLLREQVSGSGGGPAGAAPP